MSIENDGGNAFACASDAGHQAGMSLRDYFAAQAVNGLMGRVWDVSKNGDEAVIRQWATTAYAVADAMLEARKK